MPGVVGRIAKGRKLGEAGKQLIKAPRRHTSRGGA